MHDENTVCSVAIDGLKSQLPSREFIVSPWNPDCGELQGSFRITDPFHRSAQEKPVFNEKGERCCRTLLFPKNFRIVPAPRRPQESQGRLVSRGREPGGGGIAAHRPVRSLKTSGLLDVCCAKKKRATTALCSEVGVLYRCRFITHN